MIASLLFIAFFFLAFWLLYVFYIAVMALRDRRNEGTLSAVDQVLGNLTLFTGLLIDVIVNTLMSLPLLELARWHRGELLLTPRMRRLAALPVESVGLSRYRRRMCRWLLGQIDQHDKTGGHDVPEEGGK
jgi:predicted transporter